MRLLYVADGRSPIALNWIRYFAEQGNEVHLVSPFHCAPGFPVTSLHIFPVGYSELREPSASASRRSLRGAIVKALPAGGRTRLRQWLAPLTLSQPARKLEALIGQIQPDLVHAMRIPYEGMLASLALEPLPDVPLLISVWGNDFTLHAPSTPMMGRYTRLALKRANGVHADCQRDARLALEWGFDASKPVAVLPGAGGIQLDVFYPNADTSVHRKDIRVINPRGFRAYVRNDVFFKAIPLIRKEDDSIRFVCPAMADEPQAQRWVRELGVAESVELLPYQTRAGMAELFRSSEIAVSTSLHDGTPNTLLEAMACGCFPLAGDIESVREWIEPGVNGMLFDPTDAQSLAEAVLVAADSPELRMSALKHNTHLVAERAEYRRVMGTADEFCQRLVNAPERPSPPRPRSL